MSALSFLDCIAWKHLSGDSVSPSDSFCSTVVYSLFLHLSLVWHLFVCSVPSVHIFYHAPLCSLLLAVLFVLPLCSFCLSNGIWPHRTPEGSHCSVHNLIQYSVTISSDFCAWRLCEYSVTKSAATQENMKIFVCMHNVNGTAWRNIASLVDMKSAAKKIGMNCVTIRTKASDALFICSDFRCLCVVLTTGETEASLCGRVMQFQKCILRTCHHTTSRPMHQVFNFTCLHAGLFFPVLFFNTIIKTIFLLAQRKVRRRKHNKIWKQVPYESWHYMFVYMRCVQIFAFCSACCLSILFFLGAAENRIKTEITQKAHNAAWKHFSLNQTLSLLYVCIFLFIHWYEYGDKQQKYNK